MRFSKQHKMYGVVLGLAAAALGADRLVFAKPAGGATEAASAAVETARPARVATAAKAAAAPAAPAAANVADRHEIAARLDALARSSGLDVNAVADAFAPSAAWVKPVAAAAAPEVLAAEAMRAEELARSTRFAQDHRLTAVMGGDRQGVAVVDGRPLRPGQVLDGFTLVAVSAKTRDMKATFERGGRRVDLRLQEAGAGPGAVAQAN
jgi:hypothetical protein